MTPRSATLFCTWVLGPGLRATQAADRPAPPCARETADAERTPSSKLPTAAAFTQLIGPELCPGVPCGANLAQRLAQVAQVAQTARPEPCRHFAIPLGGCACRTTPRHSSNAVEASRRDTPARSAPNSRWPPRSSLARVLQRSRADVPPLPLLASRSQRAWRAPFDRNRPRFPPNEPPPVLDGSPPPLTCLNTLA